ncbi:M4 family peptidase [Massilia arenosa]|uniref:Neutral metalloproteinase n=1 Tax=Zemynaea arenosa TaxID=2561931 RepID=A0A4Y9SML8_9BURK|nr:M4 family metallopeptidase [Massilia arenosa]TFW27798.1 M4 family peptidase [Massilia arenosa]
MNVTLSLLAAALGAALAGPAQAVSLMAPPSVAKTQLAGPVVAQLTSERATHGLDADHGFKIAVQHPGVDDTLVIRLHHTYKGVRVFGSESVVVAAPDGHVVSESIADRRSGLGKGSANALGLATADFSVKPRLTANAAVSAVTKKLAVTPRAQVAPSSAELIIYPEMRTVRTAEAATKADSELNALDVEELVAGYQLAWLVRTRLVVGTKPLYRDTVLSALDGHVIAEWNALQTEAGVGHSQYNGDVPLNTKLDGKTYKLIDPTRGTGGTYGAIAVTNANHSTKSGDVYSSATNTWGDGKQYISGGSTTNANGQTAAVNAMWGMMNTYDMLKNTLGWHSLDGKDTATFIAAHVSTAYDNAYYDDSCRCMYIGDGSVFNSLGSIDVIGHEMSHGVTAATSNLIYAGESGGLNESNSDIGGEVVEAYARAGGTGTSIPASGNDWVLGKEISKNATPLRWMYKPSLDRSSPDAWSSMLKFLDVHYSSGPNNRMFYFLAQGSNGDPASEMYSKYLKKVPAAMTGIGLEKAYRIWFKAATTKFTSTTNYADARNKMVEAAQELYGKSSKEATAVTRAYAAINVGADVDE